MRRGRDLLFEVMEQLGIEYLFGNPGTTELPLIDGAHDHPGVRYVMSLHEDIAVGMAMGYARATGKPGVVNLHVAPGLAHGLGNLYNAWRARIPLVVTAGQQHSELVVHEPILTADLVEMARPFTKWAWEVRSTADLPVALQRAFKEALAPPSGPVFLSLPTDMMLAETDLSALVPRPVGSATRADEGELARAASLLAGAENPLIVAGDGVGLSDAWPELVTLAERIGAPVYTEAFPSTWNFPNRHSQWQGVMPDEAGAFRRVFEGVDVALLAGFVSQAALATFDAGGGLIDPRVKLIGLSDAEWDIGKNQPVAAGVLGDVKLNMRELLTALRDTSQRRSEIVAATRRKSLLQQRCEERIANWQARVEADGAVLSAVSVASELARVWPKHGVFVDESVSNRQPFVNLVEFDTPTSYYSGKAGGLGFSTPGALGMRLGNPRRPVVNVVGDGAFMYYPQSLWNAGQAGVENLVVIVLNNASYRVLKLGTQRMGGPWNAKGSLPPGLDIDAPRPDIASMAESMGVAAEGVTERERLGPALEHALGAGRAYVLDVRLVGGP